MTVEAIQTLSKKRIMLEDCLCSECINSAKCDYKNYHCPAWRFLDWLLADRGVELFIVAWEKEDSS